MTGIASFPPLSGYTPNPPIPAAHVLWTQGGEGREKLNGGQAPPLRAHARSENQKWRPGSKPEVPTSPGATFKQGLGELSVIPLPHPNPSRPLAIFLLPHWRSSPCLTGVIPLPHRETVPTEPTTPPWAPTSTVKDHSGSDHASSTQGTALSTQATPLVHRPRPQHADSDKYRKLVT